MPAFGCHIAPTSHEIEPRAEPMGYISTVHRVLPPQEALTKVKLVAAYYQRRTGIGPFQAQFIQAHRVLVAVAVIPSVKVGICRSIIILGAAMNKGRILIFQTAIYYEVLSRFRIHPQAQAFLELLFLARLQISPIGIRMRHLIILVLEEADAGITIPFKTGLNLLEVANI